MRETRKQGGRKKEHQDTQPFPPDWLELFDVETLERLAIMTIDGGLTDSEALTMLAKGKMERLIDVG